MATTMDKVKNALHLNKDHTTTTGTTGTTHTHHTAGTTHSGTAEGVAGPHNSRVANAADPRVDSDMDGSRTTGTTGYANGNTTTHHAGTGHTHHANNGLTGGTTTTGTGYNTTSTNAGPHNSNIANKLDPRVDSDMDGSRNMGAATTTGATGTGTGYTGTHTGNHMGTTTGTTGTGAGYTGTHAGNNMGTHTGTTGGISNSTNAGPHDSNLANKMDPRVDSDLDGRGNRHGAAKGGILGASGSHATPGSGTAQNTAGPHNSDLLNKLDPRVDADLDGSKTIGGNKTYA